MQPLWDYIIALENEYGKYRKRIMTAFSLTAAETDIIMFLSNNPCADTSAKIAEVRKMQKSQVSLSVKRLLERGLLNGEYSPNNKKCLHLKLTANAASIVEFGHGIQNEFTNMLFKSFTADERTEFLRLHHKIAENIERNNAI